jgi:hypothetical protein
LIATGISEFVPAVDQKNQARAASQFGFDPFGQNAFSFATQFFDGPVFQVVLDGVAPGLRPE